jgi:hypothetical protein
MNNVSSLAAKLRPYWLRDTKGGGATIINNYITEAPGGGGGVDLSWLVPRSFPMSAGAPITVSGDFWSAGITYGLSLDSSGGLETSSGNLRVKLQSPSGLDRTSTGVALADAVAGNGLTICCKGDRVGYAVNSDACIDKCRHVCEPHTQPGLGKRCGHDASAEDFGKHTDRRIDA